MKRSELTTDMEWIARLESRGRRLERDNEALLAAAKAVVVTWDTYLSHPMSYQAYTCTKAAIAQAEQP